MRNIPLIAIKKPATTLMLLITMVVIGFLSLTQMPVALLPNFNIPVATVVTTWPGATPEDMDKLVTGKIEDAVSLVEGIKDFYSYSSQGLSQVVIEFDYGINVEDKVDLIQTEINKIRSDLPDDINEPVTDKIDIGSETSILVDYIGEDIITLRSTAENLIKTRFQRIKGVGAVSVKGGLEKEVLVELNPYKLDSHNLNAVDIHNIIKQSNVNIPIGEIKSGEKSYLVKIEGELKNISQIENIVISNKNSEILRLKDVADVSLTYKDPDSFYRVNGQPAVSIMVNKSEDGNVVDIADKIKKDIEEISNYLPLNTELSVGYDASKFINQSINTVKNNALSGLFFASIILFLFLKSIKATAIIAVAIPSSIIFTFAFMDMKGISLNVISLMGLSLGVGMLVDNSVVVLDNIYRHHKELKKSPIAAAGEGAREIAMPIVASTATTIAVFLPIVLREGLAKEIFSDMSYSISFSLLASLIVALTFVPMISSKILEKEKRDNDNGKILKKVRALYMSLLKLTLGHRWKTLLITACLFITSLFIAGNIGGEFMPEQDESQYTIIAELPSGMEISMAQRISEILEKRIIKEKDNDEMIRYSTTGNPGQVAINVELKKKKDRNRDVFSIVDSLREDLSKIPDIKLNLTTSFKGPENSERDFQFEIYSSNYQQMKVIAGELFKTMKNKRGLVDFKSSIEGGGPQAKIIVNRDRAQSFGLRVSDIAQALSYQILGDDPITIKTDNEEIDVTVQLAEEFRRSLDKFLDSKIKNTDGTSLKIRDLASLEIQEGSSQVDKKNKIRKVTISANLEGNYTMKEAQNFMKEEFEKLNPPKTISYGFGGEGQQLNEAMTDLNIALILSIFVVYFILVSQFESFILPFIIIGSIPLSVIGVFFGLFITGRKLNIMVMVGIIMLVGIVVNNAIVLIDYINLLRLRGLNIQESLIEAGETRLRPIIMTTLTTVFGMIPLALSKGEGAEMYNGMAVAVIFGLSLSTLLTLIIIPILYSLIEDARNKLKRDRN
jgi:HAE1 family hydrophobic/amphiphilic exporter-1